MVLDVKIVYLKKHVIEIRRDQLVRLLIFEN